MVELYIDNNKVDITEDISIEFTYTSVDVSNPTAVKNSFSKTISLPGTLNNNTIFGNIWRLDRSLIEDPLKLTNVNFDSRRRVPFNITNNGVLIESGYLQLNTITRKDEEVKYNITLYGGIGDFFYNLMYNENGEEKSLYDLYYKFYDERTNDTYTLEDENNSKLMNWNAKTIVENWEDYLPITPEIKKLNDLTSNAINESKINYNITAIPVYNGKYEDFSSNKILVNDTIRSNADIPSSIKTIWDNKLPASKTVDSETYSVYNHYGVVTAPRDIDSFEAKDIRVNQMNVGLRLPYLLKTISDPDNNGGYNVIWDEDILNSPYYKYTWILLDKPDFDYLKTGNSGHISYDNIYNYGSSHPSYTFENVIWDSTPYDLSLFTNPVLHLNFKSMLDLTYIYNNQSDKNYGPGFNRISSNRRFQYSSGSGGFSETHYFQLNGFVYVLRTYSGSTLLNNYATFVHYGDILSGISNDIPESEIKNSFISAISSKYNITLSDIDFVKEDLNLVNSTTNNNGESGTFNAGNISYNISLSNTITNLQVKLIVFPICYTYIPTQTGVTQVKQVNFPGDTYTNSQVVDRYGNPIEFTKGFNSIFFNIITVQTIRYSGCTVYNYYDSGSGNTWTYNVSTDDTQMNFVTDGDSTDTPIQAIATKRILLGGTKSPFKYLTDFCKMLNCKFDYDPITKTINILRLENYYKNEIVDLRGKVDYSKDIIIKPTIVNNKYIQFKNNTPDTYPNYLYNKKYIDAYGSIKFNTKYEFNNNVKNVFNDNIYTELIPYQFNTPFFKTQYSLLPSVFDIATYDYTLFKSTDVTQQNTETIATNIENPNDKHIDNIPKLSLFDKENNYVNDGVNSFVFLNGLYKNYKFFNFKLAPYITISNDIPGMTTLAGNNCWYYNWDWLYNNYTTKHPYRHFDFNSWPYVIPYFSKTLFMNYIVEKNSNNVFVKNNWFPCKLEFKNLNDADTENPATILDANIYSWDFYKPNSLFYNENNVYFWGNEVYNATEGVPDNANLSVLSDATWYVLNSSMNDLINNTNYLYGGFWERNINDMYDKDSKEITLYARVEGIPREMLKKFYYFEGCTWLIEKIENYNLGDNLNKFVKITLLKVKNINNYLPVKEYFFTFSDTNTNESTKSISAADTSGISSSFTTNYEDLTITYGGSITSASISGNTIVFSCSANTQTTEVNSTITIFANNEIVGKLTVSQAAAKYFHFSNNQSTITTNVNYDSELSTMTFSTNYTNLVLNTSFPQGGLINGNTITVVYDPNDTQTQVELWVTVSSGGNVLGTWTILQAAAPAPVQTISFTLNNQMPSIVNYQFNSVSGSNVQYNASVNIDTGVTSFTISSGYVEIGANNPFGEYVYLTKNTNEYITYKVTSRPTQTTYIATIYSGSINVQNGDTLTLSIQNPQPDISFSITNNFDSVARVTLNDNDTNIADELIISSGTTETINTNLNSITLTDATISVNVLNTEIGDTIKLKRDNSHQIILTFNGNYKSIYASGHLVGKFQKWEYTSGTISLSNGDTLTIQQ